MQENSGATLINYQMELTLNTADLVSNSGMSATGDDIRFSSECNGGTLYSYWIENGMNTATTKIWVKIDTLLANSSKTIYMHFNNPAATSVSAINGTFIGPHSSTDSVASGGAGGATNSQRGFRFSPNENILVTAFGKREPNGSTRFVTLFDYVSQAILAQTQVSGPAAQYSYNNIASPMWLTAGTQYVIQLYQGSSDGYYFGSSSQIGQHLTYGDMRYCNSCTENTFPTSVLSGYHYGYPDLWYFTKNTAAVVPTYSVTQAALTLADADTICAGDSLQLTLSTANTMAPLTYAWTNTAISDSTSASPIVFPANTMTYYVSVTDGCGSVLNDSIAIAVNALPNINLSATQQTLCFGTETTVSVTGNDTYVWGDGSTGTSVTFTPSADTTVSIDATDALGCQNSATYDVYVLPNTSGTQFVTSCFGSAFTFNNHTYTVAGTYLDTLVASNGCDSVVTTNLTITPAIDATVTQNGVTLSVPTGATSYQWINCVTLDPIAGATNASFTPTTNGEYACLITVNVCNQMSACTIINTIGLDEWKGVSFAVYPNPANQQLTLKSATAQTVVIRDVNGKLMSKHQLPAQQSTTLSIGHLANGVYFIEHAEGIEKISVQH